ncbi:ribonuclease J [Ammonifex thiophilus]|uniref:Ribonuclease J n=1 Tax=Ammonifex thiophilus TaxID=444093 RepID=A0A3D8P4V1_9THEO|nr:ribonuclease J [Ammonifex thiophilus]RDV82559.1 ribonuclease J [Ammonifex thiophilus]
MNAKEGRRWRNFLRNGKLQIIPLGGLGEIGKNCLAVRCGNDIVVIDCGLMFPEEELLGIDVVIPDVSYLVENRQMVRGIILTHGHEDHIGALPYVLPQLNVPVYGTRLTLGLLEGKLEEQLPGFKADLRVVRPRDVVECGCFKVEFIRVSHSIPDAVAVALHTPLGVVLHTGDFKVDHTPVDGELIDFHRLAQLGEKGVLVLLSDSTNAEHPGYTMSERVVGETFEEVFRRSRGRVIIATFATNIHRVQQAILVAQRYGRKVAVAGRSMVNVVSIAHKLGYLNLPQGVMVELEEANRLPRHQVAILTTGSQGEPMSALTRMATGEFKQLEIIPGDTIIISAVPIPGNEKLVARVVDQLFKRGAMVLYEAVSAVHVSGHPCQEELKLMINLTRPRYFIPVHGEYRMLIRHAELARELGLRPENIFVAENGQIIEITPKGGRFAGRVAAGRVLVDGLGVGDVGNIVLRDRKQLAQDGILIVVVALSQETGQVVAGPDVISRGFVYVREAEALMEEVKAQVRAILDRCIERKSLEWATIKSEVRETLSRFLYERTRRRPMILPIIMGV